NPSAGGTGGAAAKLTLTSTAFTEGMTIPPAQTCTGGSHMSPPLTWTAGPSGTMSYAVALVDMSNTFVHWVIWDIPPATTMLPGNLPKTQVLTTPVMAQQVNRFTGDGYFGPCPSGSTHTYVFEIYALDVATLPNVTATSTPETVRAQLQAHDLAVGTLSGTSNASM
ncbi:MAG TPA: YbhB/YbcL family Raf kinase inhibitor-like protein, partial [Polyangia bacterium]|nr:YbhB/YbcL family Raf kinase inhibitor-like protein [Polyangia bacterium]